MKYIKTKNRIYQVDSVLRDNGFVKGYNVGEMAFIRKDQVIAQADSIEELCDGFIAETEDITKFRVEPTLENAKMYCGIKNIYGAIWTSKGLIYVAKMNEDGKLELI